MFWVKDKFDRVGMDIEQSWTGGFYLVEPIDNPKYPKLN